MGAGEVTADVKISTPGGLHCRVATRCYQAVSTMDVKVAVEHRRQRLEGEYLLNFPFPQVLRLGVCFGDVVRISARGPDTRKAIEAVSQVLEGRELC